MNTRDDYVRLARVLHQASLIVDDMVQTDAVEDADAEQIDRLPPDDLKTTAETCGQLAVGAVSAAAAHGYDIERDELSFDDDGDFEQTAFR